MDINEVLELKKRMSSKHEKDMDALDRVVSLLNNKAENSTDTLTQGKLKSPKKGKLERIKYYIQHIENNFTKIDLLDFVNRHESNSDIRAKDMPTYLWKLKKDKFIKMVTKNNGMRSSAIYRYIPNIEEVNRDATTSRSGT